MEIMEKNEIKSKLEEIFREVLENDEICLTNETTADDIEEWDSLSHIQLIVAIEKEFNIKLTSKEVKELADIQDMVYCIYNKIAK